MSKAYAVGTTHHTSKKYRLEYKIIGINDTRSEYVVQFTATGTKRTIANTAVYTGGISDPYHVTVQGIGYLGDIPDPTGKGRPGTRRERYMPAYRAWYKMLTHELQGTGSLDYTWYNFTTFQTWYMAQPNYDNMDYTMFNPGRVLGYETLEYGPTKVCLAPKWLTVRLRAKRVVEYKSRITVVPNPYKLSTHGPFNTMALAKDNLRVLNIKHLALVKAELETDENVSRLVYRVIGILRDRHISRQSVNYI